MITSLDAAGKWQLCLDPQPCQYISPPNNYPQEMLLPGTTAQQQLGTPNPKREDGILTEKYPFEGQIWLRRIFRIAPEQLDKICLLYLERTRITELWVNGNRIGTENSLCTPHIYDLTGQLSETTELVICIKNFDYPTRGGHMTSPDTQTNWIGITGILQLRFYEHIYLSDIQVFPDASAHRAEIKGILHHAKEADISLKLTYDTDTETVLPISEIPETIHISTDQDNKFTFSISLPEQVPCWSEYTHSLIHIQLKLANGEQETVTFGLRDFRAEGDHFSINGTRTMLRGKHDGLAFPLTGAAPTDLASWLKILQTAKDWGINHYRFHTCCPPEAAFAAADLVGIYMAPELPFWGTVHAPDDPECNLPEQEYLIREGLRICKAFGNHPSFCMMSLGNELWGDPKRLGDIINTLRNADPRPLYTQGSNNFQHMPLQIPEEDYWTGVRTGNGKLIRGSFAQCDAPLGRLQTNAPSAAWDFEEYLTAAQSNSEDIAEETTEEIEIQYGTGVKKVKAAKHGDHFVPNVPVVTHEVGQYNCYPDYDEIAKYTGVTEARNFEIFRERLCAAGMGSQAKDFFHCSGAFSRECYKAEIEAAMRSPHIAGFQLLDLQDFPGQGTALVGMLNALFENKGFIQPEEWRSFCGDIVPLAVFDSFVLQAGTDFSFTPAIRNNLPAAPPQPYQITLSLGETVLAVSEGTLQTLEPGYWKLEPVTFQIPSDAIGNAELRFSLPQRNIQNTWQLTIFPPAKPVDLEGICTAHSFSEAESLLAQGKRVLLLPRSISNSVEGSYCTDFWNYHMFRIISESMGKPVPVGTMGLCMKPSHPILRAMFSSSYTTPQWYAPITHSDLAVLDAAPEGYKPTVQMIDNVERNHRLGLLFEARVSGGSLLVCTVRFEEAPEDIALNRLYHAVTDYMKSEEFAPDTELSAEMLRELFG